MSSLDTRKSLSLALGVLLLAPVHALAEPFTIQASVNALTAGGSDNQNTGVLVNTPSTHLTAGSADNFASASARASAAPGSLGAFVSATSLSSSFGGATASALASFSDTLTLISGIPGFNGPVTLAFTFVIDGFLDGCFQCPSQGNVSSTFSVVGAGIFLDNRPSVTYGRAFVGGISNVSPEQTLPSIVLTTTIGEEISLRGSLGVFTGVDGVGSFGTASYGDTATFYVDVLTPGVTFISFSGADYSSVSSIPEPGTSWLVLSGVLLPLLKMVGRQRKRNP
jgi:hypothetical protein